MVTVSNQTKQYTFVGIYKDESGIAKVRVKDELGGIDEKCWGYMDDDASELWMVQPILQEMKDLYSGLDDKALKSLESYLTSEIQNISRKKGDVTISACDFCEGYLAALAK